MIYNLLPEKVCFMRRIDTFYRGEVVASRRELLPANTYNTLKLLLDLSDRDCVFVPIRPIQYMAVIDKEEVIFIDAMSSQCSVEFSWREFRPQRRTGLADPVHYKLVYYNNKMLEHMRRAQLEFATSVQQAYSRKKQQENHQLAVVLEFRQRY